MWKEVVITSVAMCIAQPRINDVAEEVVYGRSSVPRVKKMHARITPRPTIAERQWVSRLDPISTSPSVSLPVRIKASRNRIKSHTSGTE